MNQAIGVCGGGTMDDVSTSSNTAGIFRCKVKGTNPFDKQKQTVWGYNIQQGLEDW